MMVKLPGLDNGLFAIVGRLRSWIQRLGLPVCCDEGVSLCNKEELVQNQ